ncbi:sensor histidine kinase [Thermus tengchongensis]|uniref:histidine kinase n=1 Tax=Thermus tengchongensis TaxID=1214928 RepID=A0ABY2K810_9DEIN|nr:HAMP domain-containing sensor histidine kinase [Thermus tengchongensis]TFU15407.1 HAMP domain-containing histidine kinase [Thermus tengchongensis]
MSLRARLALFLALSIGLALLFQGALSYLAFKRLLEADLDRSLLFFVGALSEGRRPPRGEFAFRLVRGEEAHQSPNFPDWPRLTPGAYWREGWRVLVLEVPGGTLTVARYDPGAVAALQSFRLALLGTGGALTLLFALLASRVAQVALRPLSRLTEVARRVADSGDLSHRVEAKGSGELKALAESFNHMLERLQAFLDRERRFTRDAAHELRTPVAAALAQVEGAEAGYLPKEEALQAAKEELLRMKRLVEALLVLAREGRVERVGLDLAALARQEAEAFRVPYRGPEALPFLGDPLLLAQALRNLLQNARLHGEGRGVEVALREEGQEAVLEVRDQGPGMPEEALKEAGRPFFRASRKPGEGLGLSVAQKVAEAHGGRLELLANRPSGLVARLRLPLPTGGASGPP